MPSTPGDTTAPTPLADRIDVALDELADHDLTQLIPPERTGDVFVLWAYARERRNVELATLAAVPLIAQAGR